MSVTMLIPGMVEIMPYMTNVEKERIGRTKAKDYILNWFRQRISTFKDGLPNIYPSSLGSKVMILKSGTGSGKSVTLGAELHLNFPSLSKKYIAHTQPRVLTTIEITNSIKDVYDNKMIIGNNLGYQTRDFHTIPKKGLILMTEEVLAIHLATMTDIQIIERYAFIILDECHTRSTSMDITMFLLKKLLGRQYRDPLCPFLILTSATIDIDKYSNYFGTNVENIITVKGFNYEIKENFQETNVGNYIEKAAQIAIEIHFSNPNDYKEKVYDILIFVSSEADIKKISKLLETSNNENNPFIVIALTSERYRNGEIYRDVIKPITSLSIIKDGVNIQPTRRIIISTNVAETGLTLDYLKYVIDTGYSNQVLFDPIDGCNIFVKKPISKSNAMQRRGRVGRVFPGEWYPLFTEQIFSSMEKDSVPDVLATDVTMFIFTLIVKYTFPDWNGIISNNIRPTGIFNIEEIELIDNFSIDSYSYSMERLFVLGLIDSNYIPSPIGLACTKFRSIGLENILLILNGYTNGCNIKDMVTIAAFATIGVFSYINTRSNLYNYTNISCGTDLHPYDDFIETIFIWDLFNKKIEMDIDIESLQQWCIDNGLIYESLLNISTLIDDIFFTLSQNIGLDIHYNGLNINKRKYDLKSILEDPYLGLQEIKKIKKCIYESYRFNVTTLDTNQGAYILNYTNKPVSVKTKIFDKNNSILDNPNCIIIGNKIMKKEKNLGFTIIGSFVSVLDGFIDIDDTFITS